MSKETKIVQFMELKIPKQDKSRIELADEFSIGSSDQATIVVKDFDLAPIHCQFRYVNEILTLTNLGGDDATKIGRQKLGHGKMYILDKGDKITIGDVKISVNQEKVKVEKSVTEEEKDIPPIENIHIEKTKEIEVPETLVAEDKTDPAVIKVDEICEKKKEEEQDGEDEYEYEEVYVEEEEEEDLEKKPSLLARIFKQKSQTRTARDSSNIADVAMAAAGPDTKVPGILVRVFCFLTTLYICSFIVGQLLPMLNLEKDFVLVHEQIQKLAFELIPKIPAEITSIIPIKKIIPILNIALLKIIAVYILFDIFSHFLLGTSLALWLVGVTGQSSFIANRLKAVIRSLVGTLLAPFLLFDFPIIFGKRTFKEAISLSHLKYRSKFLKNLGCFILIPFLIIVILSFPLIMQYQELLPQSNSLLTKGNVPKPTRKNKVKGQVPLEGVSYTFGIKYKTHIPANWAVIPSIKMSGKKVIPTIKFFDINEQTQAFFSRQSNFDFNVFIENLQKEDHFLKLLSPELAKLNINSKKTLLKGLVEDQIENVILDSLSLNFSNLHEFILKRGVFFAPYLKIKTGIYEHLKFPSSAEVTMEGLGRFPLLKFSDKTLKHTYKFILLTKASFPNYQIKFKKNSKKLSRKVINKFITKAKPFNKTIRLPLEQLENWNAFYIIDFLQELISKDSTSNVKPTGPIKYFMQLGDLAVKNHKNAPKYQKLLIRSLKETDKALSKINKKLRKKSISTLSLNLNRIQKAIENNEATFFKLNRK